LSSPAGDEGDLLTMERRILARLVSENCGAQHAGQIVQRLRSYRFRTIEHQVLFECVARLRDGADQDVSRTDAGEFRPRLLAQLVRAGFPDLDVDQFQDASTPSAPDALALCDALLLR
jgi:hypothetical protein